MTQFESDIESSRLAKCNYFIPFAGILRWWAFCIMFQSIGEIFYFWPVCYSWLYQSEGLLYCPNQKMLSKIQLLFIKHPMDWLQCSLFWFAFGKRKKYSRWCKALKRLSKRVSLDFSFFLHFASSLWPVTFSHFDVS